MKVKNKTIIITDPCYIIPAGKDDDWYFFCEHEYFNTKELTNYLVENTIYGDWSCTTYNSDNKEVLGEFCADAGMVGVFELDEVLKYNPNFDFWKSRPWTTTKIDNFTGIVEIAYDETTGSNMVIGKGNINFETHQTGL